MDLPPAAEAMPPDLEAVLAATHEAIAVVDSRHCLSCWSPAFEETGVVHPQDLRPGLALRAIYDGLATRGAFGPGDPSTLVRRQEKKVLRDAVDRQILRLGDTLLEVERTFLATGHIGVRFTKRDSEANATRQLHHDVNNCLTVVLGKVHLEASRCSDEGTSRALREIETFLNDTARLLDTARGPQEQGSPSCNVSACLATIRELMQAQIGARFEVAAIEPDITIPVSSGDFYCALLNVLTNAVEASTPAAGTIRLTCELQGTDDSAWLVVSTQDFGQGMPSEIAAALGTGITTKDDAFTHGHGFSSISQLMTRCGGRAEVTSAVGKGTTVSLYFPIDRSATTEIANGE